MKKYIIWEILFALIVVVVVLFFVFRNRDHMTVADEALAKGKQLYVEAVARGDDLTAGPCLSNGLFPGAAPEDQWVVDMAHDPRLAQDNFEVNQCSAYVRGDAKHYVELDERGELIKYF